MRAKTIAGLTLLALVAGIGTGEMIYRTNICRDAIGRCFGRGQLLALINGRGIYNADVEVEMAADRYLAGRETVQNPEEALKWLITNEELRQLSSHEAVSDTELQNEFGLLRNQFADENLWKKRLADSSTSLQLLRQLVQENLMGRRWVGQEIGNQLTVSEDSVRRYYEQHSPNFAQPMRFRAGHIFLAAPPETSPEIVEAKQKLIESLATRLRGGEEFESLVWEESEDEASKARGGDLGYLSQRRVPEDFCSKLSQLKIGETSKPFRSVFGFHIVRVTEIKPSRQIPFEEAKSEIALRLTNQRRREAVEILAPRLAGSSALRRGWFWN